jgi:hypothetical protein
MENKTTPEELISIPNIINFNPRIVDREALEQMLSAHELKYIENLIQVEEEKKIFDENVNDFSKYPQEIQEKAIELSVKAMYDPGFYERERIDKDLHLPIQIAGVIKSKKDEIKLKTWKVEYHARLIDRMREMIEENGRYKRMIEKGKKIKPFLFWK